MTRICATVVAVLAVVCLLDAVGAAVFWDLAEANITNYEEETLLYGLQGLVNQLNAPPALFFNTGKENLDFPASDGIWVKDYERQRLAGMAMEHLCILKFIAVCAALLQSVAVYGTLCSLWQTVQLCAAGAA